MYIGTQTCYDTSTYLSLYVASYPESFLGEGKEPGTHCMRMRLIKTRVDSIFPSTSY